MEAAQAREGKVSEERTQKATDKHADAEAPNSTPPLGLLQLLRPLLVGMETVMRAQNSQSQSIERLEKALTGGVPLPEILSDATKSLDQRNVVNRAMFDALHAELKGYKDDFLLESVVRPVIRDLLSLYDDTRELLRQVEHAASDQELSKMHSELLETLTTNLTHHIHYVLEILERMDVRVMPEHTGKLDKRAQRVVAREPAASPEEDLDVVRSIRPGFIWRDRVIRPEEIVVKKWGVPTKPPDDAPVPDGDSA